MNGGIIDRAERGTTAYSEAEIQEQVKLAYSEWQIAQWTSDAGDAATFIQTRLRTSLKDNGLTVTEVNGTFIVTLTSGTEYTYDVSAGTVTKVGKWNDNGDGTYSYSETGTTIQVGDIVHYETILAKAENAVDSTKKAQLISDLSTYSGNTDTNYNTDNSIVRDSLTWQVLDTKDGKIRLISSTPTTSKIVLRQVNGYNNGVYLLDKACNTLYSSNKGKSQNLKIEDIEATLIYDYTTYANSLATYGGTKEYTASSSTLNYPNIYPSEIGCKGIGGESGTDNNTGTLDLSEQTATVTGYSNASTRLKVTQTYWSKLMKATDFTNSKYYALFINDGSANYDTYFLSSRCATCTLGTAVFYIRCIESGNVYFRSMLSTNGWADSGENSLRPIVTLESNVQLTGDSTNGWTIQ